MSETVDVFALKYGTMQIVSAVEAFHHFDLEPTATILVTMPRLAATSCLSDAPWGSVHVVDDHATGPRPWRRLVRYRRYLNAVKGAVGGRSVGQLFLGLYGRETCSVANALAPAEVIVLDDGTSTVLSSRARAADIRSGRPSRASPTIQLVRRSVGLDARHLRAVRFFTMMEPDLVDTDVFEPCRLSYYSARLRGVEVNSGLLWILGTNLVENGHLALETYMRVMQGLVSQATGSNRVRSIEYHPHPAEHPEKLDLLRTRLPLRIVRSPDPVEMRLIQAEALPGAGVTSFPSSALVSLRALLPTGVPCRMVRIGNLATWPALRDIEESLTHRLGETLDVTDAADLL